MRKKVIILLVILILPITVLAKSTKSSGSGSSCADASNKCRNQVGIEISASQYNRTSGVSLNEIGDRTITITPKDSSLEYVAYLITVDEGTMDEMSFDEKITKKNLTTVDDELDDVDVKRKKFTGTHSWKLGPGKEAIVIVILKSNSERSECCSYDSSNPPKCIEKLTCTAGNFKIEHDDSFKELSLSGNAAFLYVQNPQSTNLVTNVRYGTEVCTLSRAGKHFKDSKLNLEAWGGDLGTWQSSNYYGKFLSDCDSSQVAFNLTEKQIEKITNSLLQIYYYQHKLKEAAPRSIDQINQQANSIKTSIVNKYCNAVESGCNHIISNDLNKLKNITTTCNEKDINDLQEDYLYISKVDTISAKLTDGTTPWVCKTRCYEHLVVNYSPPQVVKAGLCFQYKVTVQSKTECGVNINDNILDQVKVKNKCAPVPICENDENKTQAGPNDEFDSCINQCDEGKYSQQCINSCYKKVYSNKKSNTKKTSTRGQIDNNIQRQVYQNNNPLVISLSSKSSKDCDGDGSESDDVCFKEYYIENKTANDCKTNDIISYVHGGNDSKLRNCAEFYMKAKLIRPRGHYYFRGSGDDRDWGPINWYIEDQPGPKVTEAGATTESTTNIPMQIGRASPFYFRNITEVENLLRSLVVPNNPTGYWKKYNINKRGIKRQYSSRFKCSETCYYTGCSSTDAMTSKQYAGELSEDLSNISAALSKCSTTSSCDTTEKTANFYIKVKTETEGGNDEAASPSKTGSNTSAIVPDSSNTIGSGDADMFVPANTDSNTTTGILGLCYDPNNKDPHYKTTITFPGSWIELKTGEVRYTDPKDTEEHRSKKMYYCLPYNAKTVNERWWDWAVNHNYESSSRPQNFSPTYNIEAKLGNSGSGFGKYNWNVSFQCFYASLDTTEPTPPPSSPPSPPDCYRGNDGIKETCCVGENCIESTKLDYDLRIVDLTNLFPRKRLRGFNWGSSATLKSNDVNIQNNLTTKGYSIDPVVYSQELMKKGEKIYDEKPDFSFTLNSDNVSALKKEELDFDWGKYSSDEVIPGLRYYRIQDAKITGLVSSFSRNWEPGFNNK
ncbi:MAG: hypothetical protein HFJ12_06810 [Bacilli bacterium]|nr:hypothetical protein [Bacilli bacterium]